MHLHGIDTYGIWDNCFTDKYEEYFCNKIPTFFLSVTVYKVIAYPYYRRPMLKRINCIDWTGDVLFQVPELICLEEKCLCSLLMILCHFKHSIIFIYNFSSHHTVLIETERKLRMAILQCLMYKKAEVKDKYGHF